MQKKKKTIDRYLSVKDSILELISVNDGVFPFRRNIEIKVSKRSKN